MYNIILIDDEVIALNSLRNRIPWEKYGVDQIYLASTVPQAQELFNNYEIDIMFCDIEMPQYNGLELFEWVKSFYPYVECVYITSHMEYGYMRKALQLGSFDYILKPVDEEEMDQIFTGLSVRVDNWKSIKKSQPRTSEIPTDIYNKDEDVSGHTAASFVEQACAYIKNNLEYQISIADIAASIPVSSGYLMRIFRNIKNLSVVEYITECRIDKAKQMLKNSGKSVRDIACDVGYTNYTYFSKVFKKMTGVSPNEYRKS